MLSMGSGGGLAGRMVIVGVGLGGVLLLLGEDCLGCEVGSGWEEDEEVVWFGGHGGMWFPT